MAPHNTSTDCKMDTSKSNEPDKTQAVGETTTTEQAPPATGSPTPSGDLAASRDAEGGPGVTRGGAGNSEHDAPKDPSTPVSVRPGFRAKRKTNPNSKYSDFILNTRLPYRNPTRKEPDIVIVPNESGGPSGAASVTGSVSTTASQTKAQLAYSSIRWMQS